MTEDKLIQEIKHTKMKLEEQRSRLEENLRNEPLNYLLGFIEKLFLPSIMIIVAFMINNGITKGLNLVLWLSTILYFGVNIALFINYGKKRKEIRALEVKWDEVVKKLEDTTTNKDNTEQSIPSKSIVDLSSKVDNFIKSSATEKKQINEDISNLLKELEQVSITILSDIKSLQEIQYKLNK